MRSSAPEGQHAPRAKQAPPSGSSGATAGSAGATPTSPRPQPLTHKSAQAPLRGATTTLSSQNRVSSHPRSVTGHPQLQRSQQRSSAAVSQAQPQQRSPSNSSSGNSHTGSSIKSPTPPLPKGIQPRILQPHQQKTSPQALPKSQSSFSAQTLQPTQQGIKNPPASFKQGSPSVQPTSNPPPNFGEYDDQEWDVNVGHLIIDLDADIAQADRGRMSGAPLPPSSSGTHSHQGNASGVPVGEDKHSLKMKIKRTKPPTKTSEAKHEIVKPDVMPASTAGVVVMQGSPSVPQHNGASVKAENSGSTTPRTIYKKEKRRIDVNGTTSSSPPPGPRSIPHASNVTLSHISASSTHSSTSPTGLPLSSGAPPGITTSTVTTASGVHHIKTETASSTSIPISGARVAQSALHQQQQQQQQQQQPPQSSQTNSTTSTQVHIDVPSQTSSQCETSSPASKRQKMGEEESKRDACVGTSVATITEPDCLGPCEPGSSVTLEGIVWHETEGGVLVVNVTWRGKTYVGTLLDCTKHDWAPPRFCDSPTSDLESRTPKGRAKRGRAAAAATSTTASTAAVTTATTSATSSANNIASANQIGTTELNVTETRSGKLRNAFVKGRRGNSSVGFNPPPSPVKTEMVGTKRKNRDGESGSLPDLKSMKRVRAGSRGTPTNGCSSPTPEQSASFQKQSDQDQSQASNNNWGDLTQPPGSPQLIECPEPNCSKKYKHINGLKYHQSHAHSNNHIANEEDGVNCENKNEGSELDEKSSSLPSPKPLASTLVESSSQELIKPAVLRLVAPVTNGESDKTLPASQPALNQSNGQGSTAKSSQLYMYPNNVGPNSGTRLPGASQLGGQEISITELTQKQDSSHSPHEQPTSQPNSVLINQSPISSSVHSVVLSQPKSSVQLIQPHPSPQSSHPQALHQVPSQFNSAQIQPNTTATPAQLHSMQPLSCHAVSSQNPSTQHLIYSSQQPPTSVHAIPQKQLQVSGQSQLIHPNLPQSQPQQPGPTQQLKPSMISQQPQTSQQNLKITSQSTQQLGPSSISSHHPLGFQPQTHEQPQPSPHPSQQLIQSPSRVEIKPEINNRVNAVQSSPQILTTSTRPPPLITLSDSTLSPSPAVSTPTTIPQGTPLSSLPGSTVTNLKVKQGLEVEKLVKPKDIVNGLPPKKDDQEEEQPGREDARSPAYSDISDANDIAPVIDEDGDTKDFKTNKKAELPIGGAPPYAYGLYFGGYGQPPHPYLMPPLQHQQNLPLKPGEIKDLKDKGQDKDKKEYIPVPGTSDFMKYTSPYMYSYSHIYPPGYPDPYLRDPLYKDMLDKPKLEQEENAIMEDERGPTDLSRSSSNLSEKVPLNNPKEVKPPPPEQLESNRIHPLTADKRTDPAMAYRYMNPYDARVPLVSPAADKPTETKPSTPVPLSSPCLGSTPPVPKEDKNEKRPEVKCEGVKPTMETTGPPPPPTSSAYYPPFPYAHVPFDPYRPPIVPGISLAPGFPPYLAAPPPGLGGLRYQLGGPNGPEDLSPSGSGGGPLLPPGLYTGSHKIAELQERIQKSPSGQTIASSAGLTMSRGASPLSLMPGNPLGGVSVHNLSSHMISSPSFSSPSTIFTNSMGVPQGSLMSSGYLGDRKTPPVGSRLPPHPSLPEGYPYPMLPAQFPPHFTALGMSPTGIPQVGVGGPGGLPPSGMAGGAPPPK